MGFEGAALTAPSFRRMVLTSTLLALGLLLALASHAQAAPGCEPGVPPCPPLLNEFGESGSGAGQFRAPSAIEADPVNGHVFVVEETRIDEFDSQGDFVKAWGWGVLDGAPALQVCTDVTGCMKGLPGSGPGQISGPATSGYGITLDEEGNLWVLESENRRMQKFSPAGDFLLMIGREVNKTAVGEREEQEANAEPVTVTEAEENLCTAASGDVCGKGVEGNGNGEFDIVGSNDAVDLGPAGTIYVGGLNRIQKFDEEGTFEGSIPLPGAGATDSLTVTPDGRVYVINRNVNQKVGGLGDFEVNSLVVREVGPAGEELGRLVGEWEGKKTPKDPLAVASDVEGNVYVSAKVVYAFPVEGGEVTFKEFREVVAFDASGDLINFEPASAGFDRPADSTVPISLATNVVKGTNEPGEVLVGHYFDGTFSGKPSIAYIRSYGIPFEGVEGEPEITDQFAVSATDSEAAVEALINPRFTTDTTYQVEYGPGKCSEGGCESVAPASPASLGGGAVNTPIATGPVPLTGLAPGTVYHFRFSAQNGKGGPVFSEEGTFRTYGTGLIPPCANDALRTGSGALLPDCRAYEMVSPVDKEGGEIWTLGSVIGFPAEVNQGTAGGEALTYSSYRAFADPEAAPFTSQYLAKRTGSGWSNESISPLREGTITPGLDTQYKVFSEDLASGWLVTDSEPVLAEGGLPGYRNLYHRDNSTGDYQAQCPAIPAETPATDYLLEPQGASADGSHLVIWAEGKLTSDAAPGKVPQLYECIDSTTLRLVSVLPGGEASAVGASAGTALRGLLGGFGMRMNTVAGAVSEDGSRIFWTAVPNGPGPLYVRINGTKTVEIAAANAHFRAASPEGDRVIYSVGDELFEAAVGSESATSALIADEVEGVMGTSEDTQLIYLVSREDLDGSGAAVAGKPNLYLYRAQADTFTFIGELSEGDAQERPNFEESDPVLTPVAIYPYAHSSRITPDGLHAAFTSTARLTGYDNTDRASGQADAEVFLYDAEAGELLCASCNPTGVRPQGANVGVPAFPFWSAAHIPGWESQNYASRALSEDGNRVFFEATDRLVLEDTNETQDVYQWEAPGTGTCTEVSATFSSVNGGCVDLISSGKSKQPSELVDASSDGSDVFFKTTESLWAGDPGLADIYDARIGGGFPPPSPPPVPCQAGENCQPRGPAPPDSSPATAAVGPGNVIEKPKTRKPCRKGTHKVKKAGKVRCVKNKKGKKGKAGKSGRAGR